MFSRIKTQEGLLHRHAQQNWQTASETPEKKASVSLNQHEILGIRSVSARFLVQFSMPVFFLSLVCLRRAYNGVLMSSPYAYICTSLLMLARMHPLE